MAEKKYKASYAEAFSDRAKGLLGMGVHAAKTNSGLTGGAARAVGGRQKQIDDVERKAVRGYRDGGMVKKAGKLVKNHKC
jgi:hypothetical protein